MRPLLKKYVKTTVWAPKLRFSSPPVLQGLPSFSTFPLGRWSFLLRGSVSFPSLKSFLLACCTVKCSPVLLPVEQVWVHLPCLCINVWWPQLITDPYWHGGMYKSCASQRILETYHTSSTQNRGMKSLMMKWQSVKILFDKEQPIVIYAINASLGYYMEWGILHWIMGWQWLENI